MSAPDALDRAADLLQRVLYALAGLALLGSVGLACAAVVMRYGFDFSLEWIEEGARYLALLSAFMAAGPVLRGGGHVALDIISSRLTGVAQQAHRLAVGLLAAAVGAAVFAWGLGILAQSWQFGLRTASLIFPQWLAFSIVPLGMSLLVVFGLVEIAAALRAIAVLRRARAQVPAAAPAR